MKSLIAFLSVFLLFPFASNAFSFKGLANPYGITVDEQGYIYVTCRNGDPDVKDSNGYVTKLKPNGLVDKDRFLGESTGANLHAPTGIIISRGSVFVADLNQIKIYDASSGIMKNEVKFKNNKIEPAHIFDMAIGPDLAIYATDGPANAIYRIDPVTYVASVFVQGAFLGQPHSIIWNQQKQIFLISGWDSGSVSAVEINGKLSTIPQISLTTLEGMTMDLSGTIFLSSETMGSIFRLDSQFAVNSYINGLGSVAGIAWSSNGEMLAVLPISGEVVSIPRK